MDAGPSLDQQEAAEGPFGPRSRAQGAEGRGGSQLSLLPTREINAEEVMAPAKAVKYARYSSQLALVDRQQLQQRQIEQVVKNSPYSKAYYQRAPSVSGPGGRSRNRDGQPQTLQPEQSQGLQQRPVTWIRPVPVARSRARGL